MDRCLQVTDLGLLGYADAVRIQEELADARLRGDAPDTFLLLEHPPVITLGRRASLSDVYLSAEALARQGVDLQRSTRGGLVTYHGPGQLVGYPIVYLPDLGLTVPDYVHGIERTLIRALAEIGLEAYRDSEHVGVWTTRGKIAAIGVAQNLGVTMHGFALNLQPNLAHFALINPCGVADRGVTSAAEILGHPVDMQDFKCRVAIAFAAEFGLRVSPSPSPTLTRVQYLSKSH
jgi:lipoate-protein ligase B